MDSEVIKRAKQKQQEILDLYQKTKIRNDLSISVPSADADVKTHLRALGHPICLFGEDAFDRRERLKLIAAKSGGIAGRKAPEKETHADQTEVFYTHGSNSLLTARREISESSIHKSRLRLEREREDIKPGDEFSSYWDSMNIVATSKIGDSRPLTSVAFCPFGSAVAVAGWSGDVNIFSSTTQMLSLRGHEDRVCSVAWTNNEANSVHLISGGVDTTIRLWNMNAEPGSGAAVLSSTGTLTGHEMRINRVAVHPHIDRYIASTSDDETWRLWDLETKTELLLQEGHIAPVFAVAFHPDGSLVGTSDTAGVVRVWDLRTGRSVLGFDNEHVDQVVGLDFSKNGFSFASCSGDNSVRIWDLRKKARVEILTAHEKLVSSVKFGGHRGDVLMTAGYDCVARIFRTSDFKIIKNLPLHETRIMAADMSADGRSVVTACYDRTFKIWSSSGTSGMKMELS